MSVENNIGEKYSSAEISQSVSAGGTDDGRVAARQGTVQATGSEYSVSIPPFAPKAEPGAVAVTALEGGKDAMAVPIDDDVESIDESVVGGKKETEVEERRTGRKRRVSGLQWGMLGCRIAEVVLCIIAFATLANNQYDLLSQVSAYAMAFTAPLLAFILSLALLSLLVASFFVEKAAVAAQRYFVAILVSDYVMVILLIAGASAAAADTALLCDYGSTTIPKACSILKASEAISFLAAFTFTASIGLSLASIWPRMGTSAVASASP